MCWWDSRTVFSEFCEVPSIKVLRVSCTYVWIQGREMFVQSWVVREVRLASLRLRCWCYFLSPLHDSKPWEKNSCWYHRDPTFISRGYTNWKDATTAFSTHLANRCHKGAVEALELPKPPVCFGNSSASMLVKNSARSISSIRLRTEWCLGELFRLLRFLAQDEAYVTEGIMYLNYYLFTKMN